MVRYVSKLRRVDFKKFCAIFFIIKRIGFEKKYLKIFKKTDSLKLLLIGKIQPGKGQLEALNALKYCIDKWRINVTLAIVGRITAPDYYHEIQSFINDYELSEYVTVSGFLNNPIWAYRESDAVLMCSESEAF
jgi:glycosyltransferase involved in cell wall biosynthesis